MRGTSLRIVPAVSGEDFALGCELIQEYVRELAIDLGFQDFAEGIRRLPYMYGKPDGCLLLGWSDSGSFGCLCLRKRTAATAEMKRLYVRPEYRGKGLARLLVAECIRVPIAIGYREIVLDTLPDMRVAHRLYESFGFRPIPPYYKNPIQGSRYLGLRIG